MYHLSLLSSVQKGLYKHFMTLLQVCDSIPDNSLERDHFIIILLLVCYLGQGFWYREKGIVRLEKGTA